MTGVVWTAAWFSNFAVLMSLFVVSNVWLAENESEYKQRYIVFHVNNIYTIVNRGKIMDYVKHNM